MCGHGLSRKGNCINESDGCRVAEALAAKQRRLVDSLEVRKC